MVNVLSFRFQQCFGPFTMLLFEGSSETSFLDIYLTTSFGVHKFKNTSAVKVIVFLKMFKIESEFGTSKKNIEHIFRFRDNCI